MQTNVGLSGKTLVVGLNWSVIAKSGPGRKKDIRKACVDSGFTFGVTVDGPEEAAIGLCAKKAEFPSGAALLAAANSAVLKKRDFGDTQSGANWILVERLKNGDKAGQYWMCAISQGVPVPGTDIVEDLTVTSAKLAELVEILENVEIFSVEPEILEYVAGASPSFEKSFDDLTADISAGKSSRPQKIVGVPDWFYALVASLALMLGLGLGYSWYSENQAQEMRRQASEAKKSEAAKAAQEEALRKDQSYRRADEAARKQELDKVANSLSISPLMELREWYRVVNDIPLNHGGWSVEKISCDSSSCSVFLLRDVNVGTNESLKAIVPSATFTDDGSASYSMPLGPLGTRQVSMGDLPTWPDFSLRVGTSLQQLKMSGLVEPSLGNRKELTYRPPVVSTGAGLGPSGAALPSAPATAPPPKPLGFLTGALTVKGASLWQINDLGDYLKGGEFVVDGLQVDFGRSFATDAAWVVRGSYYLKSQGGVGSAISPGSGLVPNKGGAPALGPQPPTDQPLPVARAPGSTK